MSSSAEIRTFHKRRRVIFKRDYNREIEEVNRTTKLICTLENVEQLETVRLSMTKTKNDLEETYLGILDTIDESVEEDRKLEEELLKERDSYFLNLDRAMGLCIAFRRKIEGHNKRESLNTSMVTSATSSSARLPKINVPQFNGDLRKFLDFKALFENLVHNDDDIAPVRKMHYLKGSLIEEASKTLANISVSDEGYKEAWSRVLNKYDNKRIIIHTHFNDLFSAARIRSETGLRLLLDQIDVALRGLRACGEATDRWSSILAYMVYTRLDHKTRTDFDNTVSTNASYFSFKDIIKFCETRANNVEARKVEESTTPTSNPMSNSNRFPDPKRSFFTSKLSCIVCQGQHLLIDCGEFIAKTPAERLQLIQNGKLCTNCFARSHQTNSCTSVKSCKLCQQRHHYLLHLGEPTTRPSLPATINTPTSNKCYNTSFSSQKTTKRFIVLPSAKVRFSCGKVVGDLRLLLDNCSQPTLLSDAIVRRLKLPTSKNPTNSPVRGIGFETIGTSRSCSLRLASRLNTFSLYVEADIIPATAIPYVLHSLQWNNQQPTIKNLDLADPAFYAPVPNISHVDMILGAQYVEQCLINETIELEKLVLRNTQFGWTLNGEFPAQLQSQPITLTTCCLTTTNIDQRLAQFFELEDNEISTEPSKLNSFCETHFLQTRARNEKGEYIVRLPFIMSPSLLGSNRKKAIAILNHCTRRAEPNLWEGYSKFMAEYEQFQHMSVVANPSEKDYIIPHHAVLRPDSTTTKIRVVFNASSKSDSGYSLNDILAIGPQLQPDLFDALVRFRLYPVAFTADIAMMYRCILIHPDDRQYQQIVWREKSTAPLQTFQLNTVTYGTSSAPYLAVRCLHDLAETVITTEPTVASIIKNHFYMDDLITGAQNLQEAKELQLKAHNLLASAGFRLRKYQSNNDELLANIDPSLIQPSSSSSLNAESEFSILGINWNKTEDAFHVRVRKSELTSTNTITKRQLLSEISKVFDPLGLLAPVVLRAKLLIQQIWREKIGWDDPISKNSVIASHKYFNNIPHLSSLSLTRSYADPQHIQRELIGFCDASEKAYCAVIYIRHSFLTKPPITRFTAARTRIAPIKSTTIPRLELQAAVLLTNLVEKVSKTLQIDESNVSLYTDSQVVLAWLAKPNNSWHTFVKNRVLKITTKFPASKWSYISTHFNPADLATRGLSSNELVNSKLWLTGPEFQPTNSSDPLDFVLQTMEEFQHPTTVSCTTTSVVNGSILNRFSSYTRMLHVFGRVVVFIRHWKQSRPTQVQYNFQISNYFCTARTAVLLFLQVTTFSSEVQALRDARPLPTNSELRKLEPFIDDQGLLRTTGRLTNSEFSFPKKHPIIIPKNSHFLRLYIRHLHLTFCHASESFISTFILAEFWICGGLCKLIKAEIKSCITCARYRAETYSQVMGQLPKTRVSPARPFSTVGVDFCGPFNCRCLGHRSTKFNKIYACIFICFTTRAVHIEIVSNLSTAHFLMSLHRFIARRGLPASIHSDCGTNFVGANNYLNLADESIQNDAIVQPIQWTFNPPQAPHRGGIWEAAVKSAKAHMVRVIGSQSLNYEEYVTLFTRIESILNSRPLCYRNTPGNGEFILTPSHFLIGSLPYTLPEPESCKLPLWKRYDLLRILVQSFWRTWRADYLNMLQPKTKWQTAEPNIAIGQLVLIKSEAPPGTWPSALVVAIYPDQLGVVRTVTVRTSSGREFRRDVRLLVKLPVEPPSNLQPVGGSVNTTSTSSENYDNYS